MRNLFCYFVNGTVHSALPLAGYYGTTVVTARSKRTLKIKVLRTYNLKNVVLVPRNQCN